MATRYANGWYNPIMGKPGILVPVVKGNEGFVNHVINPNPSNILPSYPPLPPQNNVGDVSEVEVEKEDVKKYRAVLNPAANQQFRTFSFIISLLAAGNISFSVANIVISHKKYFNGGISQTWISCISSGGALEKLSPTTPSLASLFWFFASSGLWAGLPVFILAIFASYSTNLKSSILRTISSLASFIFVFFPICQIILGLLDFLASFSCLEKSENSVTKNLKLTFPVLVIISGIFQLIFGILLSNLINSTLKTPKAKPTMISSNTSTKIPDPAPSTNQSSGFNNWFGFNNPSPYAQFSGM